MKKKSNDEKNLSEFMPKFEDKHSETFDDFNRNLNLNESNIIEALKTVYDPEIPVNIYDLGLIYKIELNKSFDVKITMTLTTPNCPVAGEMPSLVANSIKKLEGFNSVNVNLVWDPPWNKDMMSDDAKLALDMA